MVGAVVNLYKFSTTINVSLKGPWISKEFNEECLIHPSFWSRPVADSWNVIFRTSYRIIAAGIREYEHWGFDHSSMPP